MDYQKSKQIPVHNPEVKKYILKKYKKKTYIWPTFESVILMINSDKI